MKVSQTTQFKKDLKRLKRRGKDLQKIVFFLEEVALGKTDLEKYSIHPLRGNWKGRLDAHIEPDWILIYRFYEDEILLERSGSHSDLFG